MLKNVSAADLDLSPLDLPSLIRTPIGVTRAGTPILAYITKDDLEIHSPKVRLLIVAGLNGDDHSSRAAVAVVHRYYTDVRYAALRPFIALSVVPCGNPDGMAKGLQSANGAGGDPGRGYPPPEPAYSSSSNPESQYLWRWIGMHAPDTVVELTEGPVSEMVEEDQRPADSLAPQLGKTAVCQVGSIDGLTWSVPTDNLAPFEQIAASLLTSVADGAFNPDDIEPSEARIELRRRDKRSTLTICEQLAKVYGHELPSLAYIPAIACIGRLRVAAITGDRAIISELERLTADYKNGRKPTLTEKSGGSEFAGHILWGELYNVTQDGDYIRMALSAADRAFDSDGKPREAMPTHNEMSDAVFMACPILAQAGRLSAMAQPPNSDASNRYFEMCLRHMRFMLKLNLRQDGLHRHSPLDETAWGRGNGFPALGLALALQEMPENYRGREEMLRAFREHLTALLPHQDVTGAWHQVVDRPESYRELTSTCMITTAMARGVRQGWLSRETFDPAIRSAWTAIKARVADDGSLVDVCVSTGKQKSLRDYYDREAVLGRDARGGAMALLAATEIAAWERARTN